MPVRVRRFAIGKGSDLDPINRFYREEGVRDVDVLHVQMSNLGKDRVEYVVTYVDSGAPRVIATFPLEGQRGVAPGSTLLFVFSEPIQPLVSSDLEIRNLTTSTVVPPSEFTIVNTDVGLDRGQLRIEDPSGGTGPNYLLNNNTYQVTLKTTIQDLDGNTMEEAFILVFTASTSLADLEFDGDRVAAGALTPTILNEWEVTVTPSRLSLDADSQIHLSLRDDTGGDDLAGFTPSSQRTGASFKIILEHDNKLLVPEPTAVLPTGIQVEWTVINGLG